jgi:ankyrin repeat protein
MNFNKNDDAKEIASVLLNLGADPNNENNEGWSPLDLAVRKG